ncbi:MAG: 2-dehydropantoate 2-reductase [Chrysiogenetes bacterium]|nr:2-dehydropantoate 2-reductase [Chrysiogenetes bacterium]
MRIGVVGPGGVGGYYGGMLALGGAEVTFMARGKTLEALSQNGLTLHFEKGESKHVDVRALPAAEFAKAGPFDLILWCVKSYQNQAAAEGLDALAVPGCYWLPLQNGVETEDFLRERFPHAEILGGTCYVSALTEAPGVVRHFASGIITLGDIGYSDPEKTPEAIEKIATALTEAKIQTIRSQDIRADKWRKLVWNASLNTLSAISGCSPLELLGREETRELVRRAMYEVVDVAQASGIALDYKHADRHIQATMGLPDVRTSMAWDVSANRPVEHEALCGVVVKMGEAAGVPTPTLRIFYTLLDLYEERRKKQ